MQKPKSTPKTEVPENPETEMAQAAASTLEPTVTDSAVTNESDPIEDMQVPKGHAVLVALDADGKEVGPPFHVLWNASAIKNYGDETKFITKKKPTSTVL